MNLKTILTSIPLDKAAHFLGGAVIVAMATPFGPVVAGAALVAIALLKEVIDEITYGGFDGRDLGATLLGGGLMMLWISFVAGHLKA